MKVKASFDAASVGEAETSFLLSAGSTHWPE